MTDAKENLKEDVLKNPKHVIVCIQFLMLQGKPVFEAYKEFCKAFGDDVMAYRDFDFWWYRFLNGEFELDYDRSKEPKKRELGDMPIKIVEKIIGKLKYEERYVLPNVSKRIRNVMEESNLLFSNLRLEVHYNWIDIFFNGRKAKFECSYRGTLVRIGDTRRIVEKGHLTVAMNQFTHILKNPKLRFDTFDIVFQRNEGNINSSKLERNYQAIHKAFQSIAHQIHVKTFKVTFILDDHLMKILSYLKPGVLESIEISSGHQEIRSISDFVELEQFKQTKTFILFRFFFDAPIEKLFHLTDFEVTLKTISVEDVTRFKDAFIASPDFKHCSLYVDEDEDIEKFGLIQDAFDRKVFDIPGSSDTIQIQVFHFNVSIDRITNK